MDAGDWITLAAVIVALGIGTVSILQTYRLQRQQYRENVSEKIMDWLNDVSEGGARYNLSNVSEALTAFANVENAKLYFSIVESNISNEYLRLGNKGTILMSYFKNQEAPLPKEMNKLIKVLGSLARKHEEYRKAFLDLPDNLAEVKALVQKRNATERKADKPLMDHHKKIARMASNLKYTKTFL